MRRWTLRARALVAGKGTVVETWRQNRVLQQSWWQSEAARTLRRVAKSGDAYHRLRWKQAREKEKQRLNSATKGGVLKSRKQTHVSQLFAAGRASQVALRFEKRTAFALFDWALGFQSCPVIGHKRMIWWILDVELAYNDATLNAWTIVNPKHIHWTRMSHADHIAPKKWT